MPRLGIEQVTFGLEAHAQSTEPYQPQQTILDNWSCPKMTMLRNHPWVQVALDVYLSFWFIESIHITFCWPNNCATAVILVKTLLALVANW